MSRQLQGFDKSTAEHFQHYAYCHKVLVHPACHVDDSHRDACYTRPRFDDRHKISKDHKCGCDDSHKDPQRGQTRCAHCHKLVVHPTCDFDERHTASCYTRHPFDDSHQFVKDPKCGFDEIHKDSSGGQTQFAHSQGFGTPDFLFGDSRKDASYTHNLDLTTATSC